MASAFRSISPGSERLPPRAFLPRHRHWGCYAAVVLSGSYVEAGDRGRWRARPGDVLIHAGFDAHQDEVAHGGCVLLNLPLAPARAVAGLFRGHDPDELARLAEKDPRGAADRLLEQRLIPVPPLEEWPDLLARELRGPQPSPIGGWAEKAGLGAAAVSRGFKRAYGVSPRRYRLEVKLGRALFMLCALGRSPAATAYACGFADQAHLTRALARSVGATPARLRRHGSKFVQ